MAALLGIPCLFSMHEISIQLPADEKLWTAADASTWAAILEPEGAADNTPRLGPVTLPECPVFTKVLVSSMARTFSHEQLSDFAVSILSFTFYR